LETKAMTSCWTFALDRVDARDVEPGLRPDGLQGYLRDHAALGQDLGGRDLDPQPGRELVLLGPDAGHFRREYRESWARSRV
jgi:hypothetical protein